MSNTIKLVALVSRNLDTTCYRGTAKLCDLTRVSQADIFDQVDNPKGLQRDFNKRHAADVYEYVTRDADRKLPRAFPEVVLNVRDRGVVALKTLAKEAGVELVEVTLDLDKIDKGRTVKVSRLDGNHRLLFGNGDDRDREAVEAAVPFQLHLGLNRDQEASLFLDINATQKSLNTSHLAVMRSRLTAEEHELVNHPARVFARRLTEDEASPFHGKVYMGGSKAGSKKHDTVYPLAFTALEGAVGRMLRTSEFLGELTDADMKYAAIRNYWQAVVMTWPEFHEDGILLSKSIGVNSLAQLSGKVLDRLYNQGEDLTAHAMAELLAPTRTVFDWHRDADHGRGVSGMSGNKAVLMVSGELVKKLPKQRRTRRTEPTPATGEEGETDENGQPIQEALVVA